MIAAGVMLLYVLTLVWAARLARVPSLRRQHLRTRRKTEFEDAWYHASASFNLSALWFLSLMRSLLLTMDAGAEQIHVELKAKVENAETSRASYRQPRLAGETEDIDLSKSLQVAEEIALRHRGRQQGPAR